MNKKESTLPTFPTPTVCPFLGEEKKWYTPDGWELNSECGVDKDFKVLKPYEQRRCRGNFFACERYSKKVYDDVMAVLREGSIEGMKIAATKDPREFIKVHAQQHIRLR